MESIDLDFRTLTPIQETPGGARLSSDTSEKVEPRKVIEFKTKTSEPTNIAAYQLEDSDIEALKVFAVEISRRSKALDRPFAILDSGYQANVYKIREVDGNIVFYLRDKDQSFQEYLVLDQTEVQKIEEIRKNRPSTYKRQLTQGYKVSIDLANREVYEMSEGLPDAKFNTDIEIDLEVFSSSLSIEDFELQLQYLLSYLRGRLFDGDKTAFYLSSINTLSGPKRYIVNKLVSEAQLAGVPVHITDSIEGVGPKNATVSIYNPSTVGSSEINLSGKLALPMALVEEKSAPDWATVLHLGEGFLRITTKEDGGVDLDFDAQSIPDSLVGLYRGRSSLDVDFDKTRILLKEILTRTIPNNEILNYAIRPLLEDIDDYFQLLNNMIRSVSRSA